LKQDTLILNYLNGVTVFLKRVPIEPQEYAGRGSTIKEISLYQKSSILKLSYDFYMVNDELIVHDQNDKELFSSKNISLNESNQIELPITKEVKKLFIKIKSDKPNSQWKFRIELVNNTSN